MSDLVTIACGKCGGTGTTRIRQPDWNRVATFVFILSSGREINLRCWEAGLLHREGLVSFELVEARAGWEHLGPRGIIRAIPGHEAAAFRLYRTCRS